MKIKNISCTQFAGIRERNVSLEDGINIIYGKNESGKSTLVNLISRTLFQNARLDRRKDKDFFELYLPGARKGSRLTGDFADGKITLEAEKGTYTVSKEWGADCRCTLSAPEGIIRDQAAIDEILREALVYGEGVYSDMLFSSQRNTDLSLQTILDSSRKTDAKQEIVDTVSRAFAEGDGISLDAIEGAISAKIDEIAGKHWDYEREAPVRKAGGGRHLKQVGKILEAYYALEDARATLKEISDLEAEADRTANDYALKDSAARTAEENYSRFNTFASRIAVQSERKKAIDRIERELTKINSVLSEWPTLNERLNKAKALDAEKKDRAVFDMHNSVKQLQSELSQEDFSAAQLPRPESTDFSQVRKAQRDIERLENSLCGMNLTAVINMLGNNKAEITALRTGEKISIDDDTAHIAEAVKITVPGVMEMQLSPADVDAASTEAQISQLKDTVAAVFGKYKVNSAEELEAYAQKIDKAKVKIDSVTNRIAVILAGISQEQLEELYAHIGPVSRSRDEIAKDIYATCGTTDVTVFITKATTIAEGYTAEYGSINDLKARAFDLEAELKRAKQSVDAARDIPDEYLGITDPDAHLEALMREAKFRQDLREAALTAKTAASSRYESYKDSIGSDIADDVERAERIFNEQKELLGHWLNIKGTFEKQKECLNSNPMQDLAASFTRYLGIISEGKLESEFPDGDKLNMSIYSDNRLLDYGKLSEGTKETVSLAFRLAVLDHLFPEGGGVIIFDDPFTDMDSDRTAKSCELISECAKRHQVIFLTCKQDYSQLLKGNTINI